MKPYRMFTLENLKQSVGHQSCVLLDKDTGCEGECMAGISLYESAAFPEPGRHDFQEGFYVLDGEGVALVGECEFDIAPGMAFLVPVGCPHAIRTRERNPYVKVFWFRSA